MLQRAHIVCSTRAETLARAKQRRRRAHSAQCEAAPSAIMAMARTNARGVL